MFLWNNVTIHVEQSRFVQKQQGAAIVYSLQENMKLSIERSVSFIC